MAEQITITVSSKVYQKIAEQAQRKKQPVDALVHDVVANAFVEQRDAVDPARVKMLAEVAAYHAMHAQLIESHLGQYVAIFQGELVDADSDKEALFERVLTRFPNEVVMQRQVQQEAEPDLIFRSPRFIQE